MPTQRELEIQLVQSAQQRGMTPDKIKEAVIAYRAQAGMEQKPTEPAPKPQGATGLAGFGVGVLKGIGSTLAGAEKLGGKILDLPGKALGFKPPVDKGLLELQKDKGTFTPKTTSQKIGFGAEQIAEMFIPIPGGAKAKAATKLAGGAKGILGRGALEAGELGLKTAIQTGGDAKETAKSAAIGGAFGIGAGLLSKTAAKTAPKLRASAERGMAKALGPTTKAMKLQTEKVSPELVKRGFKGLTRGDLAKKAASNLEKATDDLNRVIESIPPGTRVNAKSILKALQDSKAAYMVDDVIVEPRAVKAIDDMAKTVKEMGPKVSFESMRNLRQILDKSVAKSKGFLLDEASTFSIAAKRDASNAIRRELAKQFPDLAKVNAEYSFWRNVDDILTETLQRTSAQSTPLGEQILGGAGAAGGFASGGIGGAVTGAVVLSNLRKAVTSSGWRTVGAAIKSRLADALANNRLEEAAAIIAKILAGSTTNR